MGWGEAQGRHRMTERARCRPPRAERVALGTTSCSTVRGAERVFMALCDLSPDAGPVHGGLRPRGNGGPVRESARHESFLQRRARPPAPSGRCCRSTRTRWRPLDLSGYDLVGVVLQRLGARRDRRRPRRSTSATATTRSATPGTRRTRRCGARRHLPPHRRSSAIFQRWRQWDWIAAQRVDRYVANSETHPPRGSARYFSRESEVGLFPPVETSSARGEVGDAGRRRRRSSCRTNGSTWPCGRSTELGLPLSHRRRTGRTSGGCGDGRPDRIQFAGLRQRHGGRAALLASAKAFVVTATEEFGIAAVEAQAAGRPVIALREGGLRETVREGRPASSTATATPRSWRT